MTLDFLWSFIHLLDFNTKRQKCNRRHILFQLLLKIIIVYNIINIIQYSTNI